MKFQNETPFLSVMLVQVDLYWENVEANLAMLEEYISANQEPVDLIVLPEMFNTGFSMNTDLAEPMNLKSTRWMKQIAKRMNAMVMGSLAIKEGGDVYNRMLCVAPDGQIQHVDKRHLFRMGEEQAAFKAGESRLMITWKGWRICPLICYDLRFPVWSRNVAADPYDLLIYVASWPARRAFAWNTLLKARAIENQTYVIGVNRVGVDGMGMTYQGDSATLNFMGEPMSELADVPQIKVTKLSKSKLVSYRQSFPAYLDADPFILS
jgi:omega-amidase